MTVQLFLAPLQAVAAIFSIKSSIETAESFEEINDNLADLQFMGANILEETTNISLKLDQAFLTVATNKALNAYGFLNDYRASRDNGDEEEAAEHRQKAIDEVNDAMNSVIGFSRVVTAETSTGTETLRDGQAAVASFASLMYVAAVRFEIANEVEDRAIADDSVRLKEVVELLETVRAGMTDIISENVTHSVNPFRLSVVGLQTRVAVDWIVRNDVTGEFREGTEAVLISLLPSPEAITQAKADLSRMVDAAVRPIKVAYFKSAEAALGYPSVEEAIDSLEALNIGDHILGGPDEDILAGGDARDLIEGLGGDDEIDGGDDDDALRGGSGDDTVLGGGGNDVLRGGDGEDALRGGAGDDVLKGDDGDDTLNGDDGDDDLDGGDGGDVLHGGDGEDTLRGGEGNDSLNGDAGDDVLRGDAGDDDLDGGGGLQDLAIFQGSRGDYIVSVTTGGLLVSSKSPGGDGDDTVRNVELLRFTADFAAGASDLLAADFRNSAPVLANPTPNQSTSAGAAFSLTFAADQFSDPDDDPLSLRVEGLPDGLTFDAATRTISGRATEDGAFAVQVTAADLAESIATDVFLLTVSDGGDVNPSSETIIGTAGDDRLLGFDGDDVMDGAGGNDVMRGGRDDDDVHGGDGDDIVSGDRGVDVVRGGAGIDIVRGGGGDDTVYGDAGDDAVVSGDAGNDEVFGGDGNDKLRGGGGDDMLDGGADDDRLVGDRGDDTLLGGDGNDTLVGAQDADVLRGGAGDDVLVGDTSDPNANQVNVDIFVFDLAGGVDTVRDFQDGVDLLDVSALSYASVDEVLADAVNLQTAAGGVRIDFDDGGAAIVRGIDLDDLSNDDFIF